MKKITETGFSFGIWLAIMIIGIAGPAGAESIEQYLGILQSQPKLMVGPHPKGDAANVFAGGLQTIKDGIIYACAVKALRGDIKAGPVYFQIDLGDISPKQIGNIRLITDDNGNGRLDAGEEKILIRAEWATDGRAGVICAETFMVKENETLALLLVADIAEAAVSSRLLVSTSEVYFGAADKEGKTAGTEKFGALTPVEHLLENPLAVAALAVSEEKIVGNLITLEGHLFYRNGVRFDEEKMKNAVIDGWKIVKLTLGKEEGTDSHRRYVSFALELPAKSKLGTYKLPSFRLYFFDLDEEKEKYISTPAFSVEKTNLIVRSDIFPQIVPLGERFRYRIEFLSVPQAGISADFFSELKLQKKLGIFDIEGMETSREKSGEVLAINIVLELAAYDYAGQTQEIPALDIPYYLTTGPESEILAYKLPAVKIAVTSMLTGEERSFRPLAGRNALASGNGWTESTGARKTAFFACLSILFLFAMHYAWLMGKRIRRKNEPLLARQKAKRRFKYCVRSYPAAPANNADNLRWFANSFSNYVRALCELKAEAGSLGFGAELRSKCSRGYEFYEDLQDMLCDYREAADREKLVTEAREIIAAMETKCRKL